MSKFCSNCGTQLDDNAAFCTNCGTPTISEADVVEELNNSEGASAVAERNKNALIGKIAVLSVAVIAVLFVLILIFTAGGPKTAVKNAVDGTFNGKYKAYLKMQPDFITEYNEENFNSKLMNKDEFRKDYEEQIEGLEDEFGKNIKVTYKIEDKEKLDKEELNELRDKLHERYNVPRKDIKSAYELDVDLKIKGTKDSDKQDADVIAYKYKGNWYLNGF